MKQAKNDLKLSKLGDLSFRLRSVENVKGDTGSALRQQLAMSFVLILAVRGSVRLIVDQEPVELDRSSVFLGVPGQTFGAAERSGEAELYVFYFDVFADPQPEHSGERSSPRMDRTSAALPYPGKMFVYPYDRLAPMSADLYRTWHSEDEMGHFRCQIDLQEMLFYIYRNRRSKPENAGAAVEYAKRYIEEHYAEPITIERLARIAELSPKYFVELYKKKYGKSAIEYVTELRMRRAKRLMAGSPAKLRDIAHMIGYADEFYFSRKFKQAIGVSPSAYMQNSSRKLAAYSPPVLGYLVPLGILPHAAPLHPKWTEYYYREFSGEIPVQFSAYRYNEDWRANLEQLRQISADLILAAETISAEERSELERIAPVKLLAVARLGWREQFTSLAADLGETWQAGKWLEDYSFQLNRTKELLPLALRQGTVAVIRMMNESLFLHCNRGMAGLLYHDLQLIPAYDRGSDVYNRPVSLEELTQINPGHILMMVRQDSESLDAWARLQMDREWLAIPAVERQRVRMLSSDPWLEYSPHAHLRMLEQLVRLFPGECP
ncbi:AraC family transcriptional regulator [Paenibacillus macerans]|uniref:AraC family transcriptional regulator n=1 Tax=Paenibacillus macerans TaxID=44252 RepID=UPI00203AAA0A|nr:AraC family transcriptional regulator [Paenibacillus macerans]MCM3698940.1 AraC family transcriptional regulator [Paenibacillus macerans]